MKDFIKQAYNFEKAQTFFENNITKETILELYTELDSVYSILESLDIVCIYTKNQILKDFEVWEDMGNNKHIKTLDNNKSIKIPINSIINDLTTTYTEH